jgi:hypothetical protein
MYNGKSYFSTIQFEELFYQKSSIKRNLKAPETGHFEEVLGLNIASAVTLET